MSKELIEQLAKEHGAAEMQWKTPNHDGSMKTYSFTSLELEAFAKAYLEQLSIGQMADLITQMDHTKQMRQAYAQTQGQSIPQCNVCGDTGAIVLERTIAVAGCCGNANRDGSCCGNAIPIPELEQYQEPCPNCSSSAAPIESGVKG
jgi:hypothetical protein